MAEGFLQLTVFTGRFNVTEVKPHFINPGCFGEDFASWLRGEVTDLSQAGFALSAPIQEDYGWGFWATRGKDSFWVAIGAVQDEDSSLPPAEGEWVVSVDYDPGLNPLKRLFHSVDREAGAQVARRIRSVIEAAPDCRIGS